MGPSPSLHTLKNLRPSIPTPIAPLSAYLPYPIVLLMIPFLWGCTRSEDLPVAGSIPQYMPLEAGRSIYYRLDSTIYPIQGTAKKVRSYLVRDRVDGPTRDQQGRMAWRIIRSFRHPADTTRWTDQDQFLAIPAGNTLEWLEDNNRVIRLVDPIREGYRWAGNRFINTTSDPARQYLEGWRFTYLNAGKPWQASDRLYPEALTVLQQDDRIGNPADRNRYSSIDRSMEVYAKGLGLVYREVMHEVWQPPNASSATGYYEPGSFALTLSFIANN